jgi:hypothetical protein
VTAYRGRPVGYSRWPGRLYRAARWTWQWGAIGLVLLTVLIAAGIAIGLLLTVLLLAYLGGAGPVTP